MTVRVGMLGAGFILKAHANSVATVPEARLELVADLSKSRAEAAARQFGFAGAVDSIAAMAASNCDVVHILLPPALHIEAATAMVEAGKSVFLEKPMGLDSNECAALCDLAAAKGVSIGVNHNFLFTPSYERLREAARRGALGQIDRLSVNWHYGLPLLQFGPFDNWMMGAPANLMFETGPHMIGFVIDLLGRPEIIGAHVGQPVGLPADGVAYRHWDVVARHGATAIQLSMSATEGHADRYLRVRGSGGSAQIDFGRDFGWFESTRTDNPMLDAHGEAAAIGRQAARTARQDLIKRIKGALRKTPDANPFDDSIDRSIRAFYEGGIDKVDPRHAGTFATDIIRTCEAIVAGAAVGKPSRSGLTVASPEPLSSPRVLVVGGTGFIGRRLVAKLVEAGIGVRVLTRNARAAALEFDGVPVELFQGHHGNPDDARRALDGIETVYHLAKCEGKRWDDYVRGDIEPTRVLGEAALAAGVKRFIYTGTIDSYASGDAGATIDSSTSVDPAIGRRNLYARSKAACEALLQTMQRERRLPLVIMRPGIVIGPGSPPAHLGVGRFTSETNMTYWGDGETALPLVLADDVAAALLRAMEVDDIEGRSFLLTGPPLLSARQYVVAMAEHGGLQLNASPRPAWRYWMADWIKEGAKNAVRHPNRRWPSLHDWNCRSHRSRYDSGSAQEELGWAPVSDRDQLIDRGIVAAIAHFRR